MTKEMNDTVRNHHHWNHHHITNRCATNMTMFIPVTRIAARTICPGGALFHHDQNIRRCFILSPPLAVVASPHSGGVLLLTDGGCSDAVNCFP